MQQPGSQKPFYVFKTHKGKCNMEETGISYQKCGYQMPGKFYQRLKLEACHRCFSQTHWYSKKLKVGTQTVICTTVFIVLFIISGNNLTLEKTLVPIDDWIDKQNVEYIHSGLFSSLKEVRNSGICYIMELHEVK